MNRQATCSKARKPAPEYSVWNRRLFLLLLFAAALAVRCYELTLPYLKIHEAGFQETLALNHLDYGLWHNRFVSLLAKVDSIKYFHVSHPPLLQYLLALSFASFGVSELVARLTVLPFSLATIYLTYVLAAEALSERIGRIASVLLCFSLLSSYFGRIVNYEVLAQCFAVWLYVLFLRRGRRPGKWSYFLLLAVFLLGCLSDWPFYLILPGLVLHALLTSAPSQRWRRLLLPTALLVGGLGIVALYLGYQKLVTGQMMLLSHGKNRMAGSHAFDPAFYELLGGRLFDYAPFLSILAPIGLLVALDRRPGALVPVLPLLFVPVAYVVIFDQAARAHEWSLYYFAVPMALLAGMALDSILSRRSLLLVSVCGVLVGVLALYNLEFHRRAKTGIFSDLYDVSIFLRDHLPRESVVYTAIYCQVGYYLEGRAEVLYSLARGDLRQHSYDCYLLDRGATDPTRRKLFPPEGPGESYRSIVASNRYDLVCRKDLFEGHLLLSGSTAPSPRLLRFGKQVRLATTHTIRAPTTVIPLPGQARSLEGAGRLSFSLALASQQDGDAEVAVLMRSEGGTEELLRREVGRREIWHDFIVDLGSSAYDGASLELEVSTPGLGGDVYLGNPLLQSHGQGLTR